VPRTNPNGYARMYGSKTFVTKFQHVANLLQIAEVIRKQSGHEQGRMLLKTALEVEKELTNQHK
jgi:glycosylphosphatidylinositol transamidase (GPIT) subunit GPI8